MGRPSHPRERTSRQTVDWTGHIERLGWGGVGVGRMEDGRIVLLSAAGAMFPGEQVTATVELHARHAEGVVTGRLSRDDRRVEPGCAYAVDCGGCSMWGAGDAIHELKRLMVDDLLARQLKDAPELQYYPAPAGSVRSRVQLHWDGNRLGFHKPASNVLVPVRECPMAADPVSTAIPRLEQALTCGKLPDAPGRWELATGTPAGDVWATTSTEPGSSWAIGPAGWNPASGPILHELGDFSIQQHPGSFFQVCPLWAWTAFAKLFSGWGISGSTLYDLYGGGGFFTLMLADRFESAVLVESSDKSCKSAAENFVTNRTATGDLKTNVVCADVGSWLKPSLGARDDTILLDPPRSGLTKQVAEQLLSAHAGRIVLIGCDGMSFCRDVNRLSAAWRLANLAAIDLFPNTSQVEMAGMFEPA